MNTRTRYSLLPLALAITASCGPVELMDAAVDRSAVSDTSAIVDANARPDVEPVMDSATSEPDASAQPDVVVRRDAIATADGLAPRDARTDGASGDGGYMLTGLPSCTAATVTAAQLYTGVVTTSCTGARCHDPGSSGTLSMGSAVQMRNQLRMPSRNANIPRVTPGDIHQSYVLYKLLGQHARITGGGGNRMPPVTPITTAQQCLFINWIRSGAM